MSRFHSKKLKKFQKHQSKKRSEENYSVTTSKFLSLFLYIAYSATISPYFRFDILEPGRIGCLQLPGPKKWGVPYQVKNICTLYLSFFGPKTHPNLHLNLGLACMGCQCGTILLNVHVISFINTFIFYSPFQVSKLRCPT